MSKATQVFLNPTKHKRAAAIVGLILGRPATPDLKAEYSPEGQVELQLKVTSFLKEAGIDPKKDEEGAVMFVYSEVFSGAVRTHATPKPVRRGRAAKAVDEDDESSESSEDDEDSGAGKDDKDEDE